GGRVWRSGNVSPSIPTTTTLYPSCRAAASTRNGKLPLPAIRPIGAGIGKSSFAVERIVELAGRTAKDDAPRRRRDELQQIRDFWGLECRVPFDDLQRATGVVLQQLAVRSPEFADELGAESAAREPDRVDAVNACAVADSL